MLMHLAMIALAFVPPEQAVARDGELLGGPAHLRAPKVYVIRSSHIPADAEPRWDAPEIVVVADVYDGKHKRRRPHRRPDRDDRSGGGRWEGRDAQRDK